LKNVRKGPFRKPNCRLEDKCKMGLKKHALKIRSGLNWLNVDVMIGLL